MSSLEEIRMPVDQFDVVELVFDDENDDSDGALERSIGECTVGEIVEITHSELTDTPEELGDEPEVAKLVTKQNKSKPAEVRGNEYIGAFTKEETTPGETDLIGYYFKDASRVPLLDKEGEVRLGRLVQSGLEASKTLESTDLNTIDPIVKRQLQRTVREGDAAKIYFMEANLRLVISIAKKYPRNSNMGLLDNIQEGNIGLGHAVDKFDPEKGFKFSTYATWWIRQTIGRARDNSSHMIRLPVHEAEKGRLLLHVEERLMDEAMRHGQSSPTEKEIADEMDISIDVLSSLRSAMLLSTVSLDMPIGVYGDGVLADIVPDNSNQGRLSNVESLLDQSETLKIWEKLLTEREYEIVLARLALNDYNGEKLTLQELASKLNITRERARQIENIAYLKISRANIFSQLVNKCVYEADDYQKLEVYFMNAPYKAMTRGRGYLDRRSTKVRFEDVAESVIDMMHMYFGKNKVNEIVESVIGRKIKVLPSGAPNIPSNANKIRQRFGIVPITGKNEAMTLMKVINARSDLHSAETRILTKLVNDEDNYKYY